MCRRTVLKDTIEDTATKTPDNQDIAVRINALLRGMYDGYRNGYIMYKKRSMVIMLIPSIEANEDIQPNTKRE